MKKTFLFFLAGALMLAGCEKNNGENSGNEPVDPNAPKIVVEPTRITSTWEGGEFTVDYSVENPVDGATVLATPQEDWVEIISCADGKINLSIGEYTEAENRSTLVDVEYEYGEGESVSVQFNVIQTSLEDNVTLIDEFSVMQIIYLGRVSADGYINADDGYYGYQVQLIDLPLQGNYISANSNVLNLVFLSDQAPDVAEPSKPIPADQIIIPDGEYAVASYGAGTVWSDVSAVQKVNSEGTGYEFERTLAGGSVTITNNGTEVSISAKITDSEDAQWNIDATVEPMAGDGRFSSTIEGDVEVDFSGSQVTAGYYGAYYQGCSLPVWYIQYVTTDNEIVCFDFIAPAEYTFEKGFPTGTFTASNNLKANTFVTGFNQQGYMLASWYMTIVEQTSQGYSVGDPMASLVGGTVEITENAGNYTIKINALDDKSQSVSGTWTGSITPLDYSQAPAQTPAKLSKVSRISPMSGVNNLLRK